jgi:phosphoribosylformimino-5-aminoimidazole carboxamide ribotide isomerase
VGQSFELPARAEITEEPLGLVDVPQREERSGELVQAADLLDVMSRLAGGRAHVVMVACYYAAMEIYPAIDVLDSRCVRLVEGRREAVTIEGGDPAAAARRFAIEGARWLHVVDLDGAFSGRPTPGLVEAVVAAGLPVQVGGGLRDLGAMKAALDAGAARIMVGTAALEAVPGLSLALLCERFGEQLVVAIDAREGRVVTEGWTAETEVGPRDLAERCAAAGVTRLLVTSTRRDGSLAGPDTELLAEVLEAGVPVLAAGGIASLDDLRTLRDLGCEGAVVGSALWSGRFTLAEAIDATVTTP